MVRRKRKKQTDRQKGRNSHRPRKRWGVRKKGCDLERKQEK